MSWFAELAGKAEDLLINLDEQTGAALRTKKNVPYVKHKKLEHPPNETPVIKKKRHIPRAIRNVPLHPNDQRNRTQAVPTKPSKVKLRSINNSPVRNRTENVKDVNEPYGYKPRRFSLPSDLESIPDQVWFRRWENLEVENAMLKNELNVTNRESKELLDRFQKTEEELEITKSKLESIKVESHNINIAKEKLAKQIEKFKIDKDKNNMELRNYREEKRELETEVSVLRERNQDLSELIKQYDIKDKEQQAIKYKTDNDLRHAQSMIIHLQSDLNKTKEECKRLESEWEAYKLRVKSMLNSKDKEIKALQQGVNLTEDTKILVDQLENLKDEREVLSKVVSQVRGECGDMKEYMETLEARHCAAERVVVALRDALREERAARNKAETGCVDMAKELKSVQMESGQKIATLQVALRDMENEMNQIRESPVTSSVTTTVSSALNVADFDVKSSYYSEEKEKINYLTDKLVQRQNQIETLLADNIMLKIQVEKLESKWQAEILRGSGHSSVVCFQDGGQRVRAATHTLSLTGKVSRWCGILIRSHPLFGIFLVMYMVRPSLWYRGKIVPTVGQKTGGLQS